MDQAENLRNLVKRNSQQHSTARVITITSGKGGVGKSSVSVNLAIQLRKFGKRVIILDADFGLANIEVMLGIRPKYNLADLMYHGKGLTDIITIGPQDIGFISGGSGIQELTNLNKDQVVNLSRKLYELDEEADIVIVDTGAGIADSVLEFVMSSSEVLLIATPEPTSITDAYALLKTLDKKSDFCNEDTLIKMVANRTSSYREGKEIYNKLSIVVHKFLNIRLEFLGTIPQDENVLKALIQQRPVALLHPASPSSRAIYELAEMLCDNKVGQQGTYRRGITKLFSNLMRTKSKK